MTARVEAGELPPVEERLPTEPMVLEPVERVGNYGGTWNTTNLGSFNAWIIKTIGYENLFRWAPDMRNFSAEEVVPNVVQSFEISEDATEYTFRLREGMKWSDGQPFTADDIMFWYEAVFLNETLTPAKDPGLVIGGEPVRVEKLDDATVKFVFAAPNGLFLQYLASPSGLDLGVGYPRHYLEPFHEDYADPEALEERIRAEGFSDWAELFSAHAGFASFINDADKPTLHAWTLTKALGDSTTQLEAVRNPYYWKVDTAGNQLPYLDRVVYDVLGDREVIVLRGLNGDIDMQDQWIDVVQNKPLFFDNQEAGNYHFFETLPTRGNELAISFNLTHKDPVKREVFSDKNFRIGLSHAINRQEIIDLFYTSQGEPWQTAPRRESEFFDEEMAKQYTEYDPELANEYLDKVMPEKDAEGFRLGPDGKRFSFEFMTSTSTDIDMLELIKEYWAAVGVQTNTRLISRDLQITQRTANEIDAATWGGGGSQELIVNPGIYFPQSDDAQYAIPWVRWYENPEQEGAVEPSPGAQKQMELYRQLTSTADAGEQADLMREILAISKNELYTLGLVLPTNGFGIVKNNFHNVPEEMLQSWQAQDPAYTNPAQYFQSNP